MAKRSMTAADRTILDRVIRKIGKRRIYEIYLQWNEGTLRAQKGETVGLFHFLNEITRDYSYNAIFAAIDESKERRRRAKTKTSAAWTKAA